MRLLTAILVLGVSVLIAQDDSQGWRDKGKRFYWNGRYQEAVEAFEHARDLSPNDVETPCWLADAYMKMYIPGASAAENLDYARKAEIEFRRCMDLDPGNSTPAMSLGNLAYQMAAGMPDLEAKTQKLEEARGWYEKAIAIYPDNKESYYTLGVIDWSRTYPRRMGARAQLQMRLEDPGPISDPAVRLNLREQNLAMVEDGISNLEHALSIDPEYDDAMAYMNLLFRERADLADTPEQYIQDTARADEWVQKALDVKRRKVITPGPAELGTGVQATTSQRIRVGMNVQAGNLIRKVQPVYPQLAVEARIQGLVRFVATIGKDGRVVDLQLVSGHPLLVAPAKEAVQQYGYTPTLLNGEPVEVVTQIEVKFSLPN